jgi:CubicO group peptidase (beta-lactamase class C family)
MRKDSLFRIAFLTKPITCAGIMVLLDEGKISVIDPVEKYLPEYKGLKMRDCAGNAGYACEGATPSRSINIDDLMVHTSGLESNSSVREGAEPTTLAELAALGAKTQLLFEPGTSWNYSNIGYNVLGRLIEVVSKQPYDAFLKEKIFEPLGMRDTYFFVPEEKMERLATLYTLSGSALTNRQCNWARSLLPRFLCRRMKS